MTAIIRESLLLKASATLFSFFVFNLVIEFKQFSHKLVLDALRDFLFCDVFKAPLISFDQ